MKKILIISFLIFSYGSAISNDSLQSKEVNSFAFEVFMSQKQPSDLLLNDNTASKSLDFGACERACWAAHNVCIAQGNRPASVCFDRYLACVNLHICR